MPLERTNACIYALLLVAAYVLFDSRLLSELRPVESRRRRQTYRTDTATALHQALFASSGCLEDAFLSGVMTENNRDEVRRRVVASKTLMLQAARELFEAELAVTGEDEKLKKCRVSLRDWISHVLTARSGGVDSKQQVFDDIKLLLSSSHVDDASSLQLERIARIQNSFVKLRRQQQEWFANTDLKTGLPVVKAQDVTPTSEAEKPMTKSAVRRARKKAKKAFEATVREMVAGGENVSPAAEVALVSESYERPYVSLPTGLGGPAFLVSTDLL